jgi:hypothetical protein
MRGVIRCLCTLSLSLHFESARVQAAFLCASHNRAKRNRAVCFHNGAGGVAAQRLACQCVLRLDSVVRVVICRSRDPCLPE